mmetsp:Transcript_34007/g.109872  ORF Transcript_34007/g.109872 Transcript_34007/m.109872 type:complete len:268 (+) Transcript_34007:687-1490(+)
MGCDRAVDGGGVGGVCRLGKGGGYCGGSGHCWRGDARQRSGTGAPLTLCHRRPIPVHAGGSLPLLPRCRRRGACGGTAHGRSLSPRRRRACYCRQQADLTAAGPEPLVGTTRSSAPCAHYQPQPHRRRRRRISLRALTERDGGARICVFALRGRLQPLRHTCCRRLPLAPHMAVSHSGTAAAGTAGTPREDARTATRSTAAGRARSHDGPLRCRHRGRLFSLRTVGIARHGVVRGGLRRRYTSLYAARQLVSCKRGILPRRRGSVDV